MPVYTKMQDYAVTMLRKLHCARHDQIHWLMECEYPYSKISAATEMHRLTYLGKAVNDGTYYYWPGCGLDEDLITALDIMRQFTGDARPIFDRAKRPCKLLFFVINGEQTNPYRIYFPKAGEERECCAIAEAAQLPLDHAVIFYIENLSQIPLLQIGRPYVFVRSDENGGYEFIGNRT